MMHGQKNIKSSTTLFLTSHCVTSRLRNPMGLRKVTDLAIPPVNDWCLFVFCLGREGDVFSYIHVTVRR